MSIEHAAVCINGILSLECLGTGQQSINQCIQSMLGCIVGVDVSTQHGSVSQHSGLVHGDTHNGQFVDVPGDLTAALAEAKGG